jgi:hypothetical protein
MKQPLARLMLSPFWRFGVITETDGKITVEIFATIDPPEPRNEPTYEWDQDDEDPDSVYYFVRDILWLRRNVDAVIWRSPAI